MVPSTWLSALAERGKAFDPHRLRLSKVSPEGLGAAVGIRCNWGKSPLVRIAPEATATGSKGGYGSSVNWLVSSVAEAPRGR